MNWHIPQTSQTPRPIQIYQTTPANVPQSTIKPRVEQTIPVTKVTHPQTTPTIAHGNFDEFNSQCGVQSYKIQDSTGLVVNGMVAAKGQVRIYEILFEKSHFVR